MGSRWYSMRAAESRAEILIFAEIGEFGVTARQFVADLQALGPVRTLTLRINSPGGSVFDGLAIFNALDRHPARKTVCVDGIAASIASVVAMAGNEIVMPANALMMVHEPNALALGTADDMRAMADALDRMKASLLGVYARRTGLPDAQLEAMMAAETWLSADEARQLGFADRIDEPVRIAACFDLGRFRNPPKQLEAMMPNERTEDDAPEPQPQPRAQTGPQPVADDPEITDPLPPEDVPAERTPPVPGSDQPDGSGRERRPVPANPPPDPARMTAEARADALAYACEVAELCTLAGAADRIAGFLARATPPEEVRAALLQARAARDAETAIDGTHAPTAPRRPGAAWEAALGRTFRQ